MSLPLFPTFCENSPYITRLFNKRNCHTVVFPGGQFQHIFSHSGLSRINIYKYIYIYIYTYIKYSWYTSFSTASGFKYLASMLAGKRDFVEA